jgi:hypothetical protein
VELQLAGAGPFLRRVDHSSSDPVGERPQHLVDEAGLERQGVRNHLLECALQTGQVEPLGPVGASAAVAGLQFADRSEQLELVLGAEMRPISFSDALDLLEEAAETVVGIQTVSCSRREVRRLGEEHGRVG